jgi:CMP-N,N'-diacetyllegionaminic acid synthase
MKAGALIPCRKGSKGIPGKNFKLFNGKPLVEWTIDAAQKSDIFSKIIVSSDGGARHIVLREGDVDVLDNRREKQFSTDDARLDPLLWYYADQYPDIELWCLLQPTSPLRGVKDIKAAYRMAKGNKYDSVVSVTPDSVMCWIADAVGMKKKNFPIATYHPHKRPNRQDRQDWYRENGAIYFTKRYVLEQMRCRLGGTIGLYVMPPERSLELDIPLDWFIAEKVVTQWAG